MLKYLVMIVIFICAFTCMAQGLPGPTMPEMDLSQLIQFGLANFKTMGWLGGGMFAVLLAVQLLKSPLLAQIFSKANPAVKPLILIVLGQVYGVLYLVFSGANWGSALVVGLITSGGAIAIWEGISPLFKKKV